VLLSLTHPQLTADTLADALRANQPPVVVRILDDSVVADLRTVAPEDEPEIVRALVCIAERGQQCPSR
jgi:seryl-tRNA(Sec) selenium transferase